ncbi:hypothetical protein ACQEVZ_00310 [Dactylosporangium sp. CA-152071]|uniref:hypothetical protein n=1 Tax=Dactylosporangium sp. CA-152071 TaxID=3239933 RepID=UPI003D9501C0
MLSLAPVLQMRPVDLLAIAGGAVPAEFVPADPGTAATVESLLWNRLDIATAEAMRDHARSLPRLSGPTAPVELPALPALTFGAVFTRLMELRSLTRKSMAYGTSSAQSTIARAMGGGVLGQRALELLSALLCLRSDDVEAMAGWTVEGPPAHPWVRDEVPILWATGELLLALAPLQREQVKAVLGAHYAPRHPHGTAL